MTNVSYTATPYWAFRRRYHLVPETSKRLLLTGEALVLLRSTHSQAVKARLQTFVTQEQARLKAGSTPQVRR